MRNAASPLPRAGTGITDAEDATRTDEGADEEVLPRVPGRQAGSTPGGRLLDSAPAAPSSRASRPSLFTPTGRQLEAAPGARPSSGGLGGRTEAPEQSRVPPLTRPTAAMHLSPRMTAIFGGLFGLATVTSIIALLIQVVPVRDERALIAAHLQGPSMSATSKREAPDPASKKKQRTPIPGPWRISELAKDASTMLVSDVMERRSFITALADKGVPKAQVYRILKAFEGLRKFDRCGRKDRFTVAMDRATKRVQAFEYEVAPSEVYQAREDANGLLAGTQLDMKIAEEEVIGAFYVSKDLAASYRAGGFEDGILDVIDDALNGRMSTESFEEGGTVRLIATEETALGLFSKYKKAIALEYRPADPAGKPVRAYHFVGQEGKGYFDERGRQPYAGGWRSPIPGAPVTSKFNPKRMHPVLKKVMPHTGTDFGAPMGTPIYAVYRGVVEFIGAAGPSGNLVTLKHPNGISTGYAHMSRFAAGLKVGDRVGTHQLVGYVGSTGRSTGPHLHFTAKKDGKFFDAETLDLDGERVMPGVDRPAFTAHKEALDKRLDAIPLPEPPPEPPPAEPAKPDAAKPEAESEPSAAPAGSAAADAPPAGEPGKAPAEDPAAADPAEDSGDEEGGEMIKGADLKNPPK
ncbi:MAG TPA: M23 family metallopeptidase [Candidatus Nanopelagicales bacterium]|nr:M23 family metallopeptidase [Candidatus Nanopelagicales bacterium]